MTPTPESTSRWATRLATAAALLVGLGGLGCLGVSVLPFELVKARLDALAADGDVEWFTPEEFARRAQGLRVLGVALLVLGAALFAKRSAVARGVAFFGISVWTYTRDAVSRMLAGLGATGSAHLALFVGVFAVGFAARAVYLTQPVRYDEAFTFLNFASRPWPVALSDYSWPNNHILHTAFVRVSYLLFGDGVVAIRLPAFVAGALVPPATYLVVRMFYGARAAILAMGLTAVSSPLVLYSTNARGYTMLTLAALVLLALACDLERRSEPGGWAILAIVSALGAFTLPVMLYPFGIVVLWLAASALLGRTGSSERHPDDPASGLESSPSVAPGTESGNERRLVRPLAWTIVGVGVLTLLFYLPAIFNTGLDSILSNQSVRTRAWSLYLSELPTALRDIWAAWNVDHGLVVTGLLVAGAVVYVVRHGTVARHRVPLWAAVVAWTVALTVVNRGVPFVRVWLFLVPLYLGFAAVGIDAAVAAVTRRLGRTHATTPVVNTLAVVLTLWVGAGLLRSGSVPASDETGTMRDAEAVAAYLDGELSDGDGVLAKIPADGPLMYYLGLRGRPPTIVEGDPGAARTLFVVVNRQWGETLEEVLEVAAAAGRSVEGAEHLRDFEYSALYRLPADG